MDVDKKEKIKKPFNVVLLGNIESEKAALLHKYIKKRFAIKQLKEISISEENGEEDPNIDEVMNSVEIHGETVRMKIWDNVSANKLFTSSNKSLKVAQGIILFYSVSNRKSFNMLKLSLSQILDYDKYDIPMIMVGNDSDTPNREVTYEEAQALANSYGLRFHETSIKSGMGDIFEDIGEQVFYRRYGENDTNSSKSKSFINTKGLSTSKSTRSMNQKLSLYSNDELYQNSFNNKLKERKGKNLSIFSLSRGTDRKKNKKKYFNDKSISKPDIDLDESMNSSRNITNIKEKNKNEILMKSPDVFTDSSKYNDSSSIMFSYQGNSKSHKKREEEIRERRLKREEEMKNWWKKREKEKLEKQKMENQKEKEKEKDKQEVKTTFEENHKKNKNNYELQKRNNKDSEKEKIFGKENKRMEKSFEKKINKEKLNLNKSKEEKQKEATISYNNKKNSKNSYNKKTIHLNKSDNNFLKNRNHVKKAKNENNPKNANNANNTNSTNNSNNTNNTNDK